MQLQKRKKNMLKIPILVFFGVVVLGIAILFGLFHVRQVDVIGNEFYTASEVQKMMMSDSMGENTLYLLWKYSDPKEVEKLPFFSDVEIRMVTPYHIQIQVYEKPITGYLMFSGSRVYFDTDGNVVDISGEERKGVYPISGVSIGQPEVGEKLPVEDQSFLHDICELSRQLTQNELSPDEIHFDDKQQAILYFGSARVLLGPTTYLEGKISNLKAMFEELEGMSGTLHMENYEPGVDKIPFRSGERGAEEEELLMNLNKPEQAAEEEGNVPEDGIQEGESEAAEGGGYVEDPSRITTDASGQEMYTDEAGNITYDLSKPYLGEDGQVVTDGYGYIDPYTGAYFLLN